MKYVNYPFASGADGTQLLYPKDEKLLPVYLYMTLKNINLKSESYTRHFKFLKEKYIIIPDNLLLDTYNELCEPIFDKILNLQKQNQNLK
jgi:type I restriction enzyme S subunit